MDKVEIKIADNGFGIPDKIFQPFFTTKPTGERTEFIIQIPVKTQ